MRFRARKTVKLGPIHLNFTQSGFSSWSLRLGRYSWNSKRGHTFDTPGWGRVEFGERPGRKRARRAADSR